MKIPEINTTESWHLKDTDDIIKETNQHKVITCDSYDRDGDTCITLPSKLNGENYSKYGVVKPVPTLKRPVLVQKN